MLRGLTDYPPSRLTAPQRELWERIYVQSEAFAASGVWGDEGYTWPAHVATKVTNDLWTRSGSRRRLTFRRVMPPPGDMIAIGFTIDAQYFDPKSATIKTWRPRGLPLCLWSEDLQAVVVFTKMRIPNATMPAASMPKLLRLYKSWHDGKMPKDGVADVDYDAPTFTAVYPCVAESYRSDKFHDHYRYQDYVHHNEMGANGSHGPLLYMGPSCVMIRGGRLRLTPRGLDH